ncbi:Por secretion system C-terminal sorting domain-containing protein [Dyadobacter koreensis]|uniref:Por secretion system C-terminal sorting domain-containing protein n=1 Tax=Dyadobacter koreensis TaxID=408657 RepID=A0A1H6WDL2_9BACT|nr:T9SS type A sorting domain-containing protein [Dyadobacter koreensis]SEJ14963.1 Por secretion system C-terminal sorting domain-containing protein [Dyadobacter koreensis]
MNNIYLKGLLLMLLANAFSSASAQIYSNVFTGSSSCPTPGNLPTVATNASGTVVTRNTITCMAASNVLNSSTLNNTAAINESSYIEFSVTPDIGYQLNITSLSFFIQGSITAPNQLEVRYSSDGFATSTNWGAAPKTVTSPGITNVWDFDDISTIAGETVTFRFYPYGTQRSDLGTTRASASGTIRLDNIILNGTVLNPMPVKLITFQGSSNKNTITLKWQTAWEEQNEGFEIQQSTDAVNFEKVGFVTGNSTTKSSSNYEFSYPVSFSDRIYYLRLKQLDIDGRFEYSKIISLKSSDSEKDEDYIYPNPSRGNFTLSSSRARSEHLKLFDRTGREINIQTFQTDHDDVFKIQVKNTIQPGLYYLRIADKENPVKVLIGN